MRDDIILDVVVNMLWWGGCIITWKERQPRGGRRSPSVTNDMTTVLDHQMTPIIIWTVVDCFLLVDNDLWFLGFLTEASASLDFDDRCWFLYARYLSLTETRKEKSENASCVSEEWCNQESRDARSYFAWVTRHDTQRTLFLPSFCPPVESHSESNHRTAIIVQRPRDNLYNIGRLT